MYDSRRDATRRDTTRHDVTTPDDRARTDPYRYTVCPGPPRAASVRRDSGLRPATGTALQKHARVVTSLVRSHRLVNYSREPRYRTVRASCFRQSSDITSPRPRAVNNLRPDLVIFDVMTRLVHHGIWATVDPNSTSSERSRISPHSFRAAPAPAAGRLLPLRPRPAQSRRLRAIHRNVPRARG